jgi:hypothetical protein
VARHWSASVLVSRAARRLYRTRAKWGARRDPAGALIAPPRDLFGHLQWHCFHTAHINRREACRLRAIRGPGESYSDVILRLAAKGARAP